jgi:hypothetical protein
MRRAGIVAFKIDGEIFDVKGNIQYGLGKPVREAMVGHDRVHGYKELPTAAFCELEITDGSNVSLDFLASITESTIQIELANGKIVVFRRAFCTNPDGLGAGTEEGNIALRFEAEEGEEV